MTNHSMLLILAILLICISTVTTGFAISYYNNFITDANAFISFLNNASCPTFLTNNQPVQKK